MTEQKTWKQYKEQSQNRRTHHDKPPVRAKKGSASDLRNLLHSIDHRGYPAYKELTGQYNFQNYILSIDHVQGDPFASPSAVSIHIAGTAAGFPENMWKSYENRRALQDHLIRLFASETDHYSHRAGGSGKSGLIACSHPGQEILDRSACQIDPADGNLIFRLYIGFPAAGRTVLAENLEKILFDFLPRCVQNSLFYKNIDRQALQKTIDLTEDQTFLRAEMKKRGLIAFIADGSILPRESGISQKPMKNAVPFRSPEEDAMTLTLPHRGAVRGMGIKEGITLIIGGGYHGKSTLLQALERGVYNHIDGDGRELVLTDDTAVKIRAEDGRCVKNDDIFPFIRNLPNGKDTHAFSTEDASGSTSQAASVTEAIESGARVLLMDEDTCATNFMVRDELMQRIVSPDEEPIIPYSSTMRPLFMHNRVSTILVAGSSGAFFEKADLILQMDRYVPRDVTGKVRAIVLADRSGAVKSPDKSSFTWDFSVRKPVAGNIFSGRGGRIKTKTLGKDGFMIEHETIDLKGVEQIVDSEQTQCLAQILLVLSAQMDGRRPLQDLVGALNKKMQTEGIAAAVSGRLPGNLALPRVQEIYAAVNRCRGMYQ